MAAKDVRRNDDGTAAMQPMALRLLLNGIREHGVSPEAFCNGLGFSPTDLDRPRFRVSHLEAVSVAGRAMQLFGDPVVGFNIARHHHIVGCGLLALGMMASSTWREANQLAMRHLPSYALFPRVHLDTVGAVTVITATGLCGEPLLDTFSCYLFLTLAVQHRRQLLGAQYRPLQVEFANDAPANVEALEAFFQCKVRFGSSSNRLLSSQEWESRALPTADRSTFLMANDLLEHERVAADNGRGLGAAVERAVMSALPRVLRMGDLAASLNMSERTFRRRLLSAGLDYQGILDRVRRARAQELIEHGRLPIEHVAAETGFVDARSFRRAFRRWTGVTPSDARAAALRGCVR